MVEVVAHAFVLSSPPDDVNTVHDRLADVWSSCPSLSMTDRFAFETALIELAGNVIRHARVGECITWTLDVETTDGRIAAVLTDSGVDGTFDFSPWDMPDELQESGRGLALIKALVHDLRYHRDGDLNRWSISRRLTA